MRTKTSKRPKPEALPESTWASVEALYREGIKSNREIAKACGVSEAGIRKRAQQDGWVRGEPYAVRALAHQKADDVKVPKFLAPSPERLNALAEVGAEVLTRHRSSVATMAGLAQELVSQLTDQTRMEPELRELITDHFMEKAAANPLAAAIYKQQMNAALHSIGLNTRSKTMLNLTGAVAKLVELERKCHNLDADNDTRNYEDLLAEALAAQAA